MVELIRGLIHSKKDKSKHTRDENVYEKTIFTAFPVFREKVCGWYTVISIDLCFKWISPFSCNWLGCLEINPQYLINLTYEK